MAEDRPEPDLCPVCGHSMLVHEKGTCTYSIKVPGGLVSCECGRPAAA